MLMLWMFGVEIRIWGHPPFCCFLPYLRCRFSDVQHSEPLNRQPDSVIGASGAVLGVLTIYAYYFPHRQVLLFFVLPVNIRIIVIGYALYSLGSIAPRA